MLENYWYIACRSKALKNKPVAFTLFDRQMVLFRDRNGQPTALEDRCQHRNARLSCGQIIDGTLRCPYHGWRYDATGTVIEIPYSNSEPNELCPIPNFPCCESDGYIWVSAGQPAARTKPYAFPHLGESGWVSFRMDTQFDGPVESCLENFLDCPHAIFVHRYWFRSATAKRVTATIRHLDDGAIVEYSEEPREKSVVWSLLTAGEPEMKHTDRFIAPATSRVDYQFSSNREYIISSSCTPINQTTTRVHTVVSFRFGKIAPLIRLFFEPLSHLIIQQDVRIIRQQQANIQRFGKPEFTAIEQDVLFKPILAWRKALRNGTAPPVAGQVSQVEMRF